MTHSIHDFTAKLRQPAVVDQLRSYVAWRRAVASAAEAGVAPPPPPAQAPISINLDLTTACNYKCDHCIDWDILNSPHKFTEEVLRAELQLLAERGLRSVILIGGGEPTLYPGFVEFVRFLKGLGLQVAIVSNGSRGDRLLEIMDVLDANDWIRLSLDAGSNELFADMHRPVNAEVTLDAICDWIPKLRARNPLPRVGFSYIIVWRGASRDAVSIHENIHEIVSAAERAKAAGFSYIAFKPFLERTPDGAEVMAPDGAQGDLSQVLHRIRDAVDRAKVLADATFDVYEARNLRVLEEGNWRDYTRQPRVCHMQALRQVLTPMGLFNCPAHRGVEKARVADVGGYADADAAQQTGTQLAHLLETFDASQECQEVTCLYHDVNWWLDRTIGNPEGDGEIVEGPDSQDFFL